MSYNGGKGGSGVFQWIINQIPPHDLYLELFLGDGSILRNKRPARRSIGVEINPAVVAERWHRTSLPGTTVIVGDALEVLRRREWPREPRIFIYLDPPYLMETRSCQRQLYQFELAEREEHEELLSLITTLPKSINVAISGYASDLYSERLASWRTSTFQTVNRAGKPATEWLWMNYPQPFELHDYRYLGGNFRERERMSRKQKRWKERLAKMPLSERYALLEALEGLRSSISPDPEVQASLDGDGARGDTSDLAMVPAVPLDLTMPAEIAR